MEISVYVDGAGGEKSGYGFFIKRLVNPSMKINLD